MLVDLLDQLAVDIPQLGIQPLDLGVQTDQRLFVRETRVEVGDGVESRLFELLAHQLYYQNRRGKHSKGCMGRVHEIEAGTMQCGGR